MPQPRSNSPGSSGEGSSPNPSEAGSTTRRAPAAKSGARSTARRTTSGTGTRASGTRSTGAAGTRSTGSARTRSTGSAGTRSTGSAGTRAQATSAGSGSNGEAHDETDPRIEALADRVRNLNERIINAGRDAGETTLSAYEKALKAIAASLERGAESSDVEWFSQLLTTQAKFIRDVTNAWASVARQALKQ